MRHDYVDLKYKPKNNEVLCMFYVEPAEGYSLKEAATHLAGESSIDTWADIVTL
ncbi:MAG: ribulose-bisphosphate carboxylase large subunit, partial [Candidatus Heimdallarchaeaceae archaeon]